MRSLFELTVKALKIRVEEQEQELFGVDSERAKAEAEYVDDTQPVT